MKCLLYFFCLVLHLSKISPYIDNRVGHNLLMDISKNVASKFTFKRPSKLKMWADARNAKKKNYKKMVTLLLLLDDLMILKPCFVQADEKCIREPKSR